MSMLKNSLHNQFGMVWTDAAAADNDDDDDD